jgi:hypothetical protein
LTNGVDLLHEYGSSGETTTGLAASVGAAAPAAGPTAGTLTVAIDFGRVREAPSPASPILFRLLEGDIVQGLQTENDWVYILHSSGWQGWAHKSLFAEE